MLNVERLITHKDFISVYDEILKSIDRVGRKSMGLGGVRDFVAYARQEIAAATQRYRPTEQAEHKAHTEVVGDASSIAAGAEVGGKKSAGPGSLFAMMVKEKGAKADGPSWKLDHKAD